MKYQAMVAEVEFGLHRADRNLQRELLTPGCPNISLRLKQLEEFHNLRQELRTAKKQSRLDKIKAWAENKLKNL